MALTETGTRENVITGTATTMGKVWERGSNGTPAYRTQYILGKLLLTVERN